MESSEDVQPTGEAAEFEAVTSGIPDTLGGVDGSSSEVQSPSGVPAVFGLTEEALAMVFGFIFTMVSTRIGEGGKFWELSEPEKANLARVWLPVLGPYWQKWLGSADPSLMVALMCTAVTLGPRLVQDNLRRASMTGSTETVKSGASSSSPDQPEAANPQKLTDLSDILSAA